MPFCHAASWSPHDRLQVLPAYTRNPAWVSARTAPKAAAQSFTTVASSLTSCSTMTPSPVKWFDANHLFVEEPEVVSRQRDTGDHVPGQPPDLFADGDGVRVGHALRAGRY